MSDNTLVFFPTELTQESFKELLPYFFEEIQEDFELLLKAKAQNKLAAVRQLAHKIKGTAASYGASSMLEKARLIQKSLDDGNPDDLTRQISELENTIALSFKYAKQKFWIRE